MPWTDRPRERQADGDRRRAPRVCATRARVADFCRIEDRSVRLSAAAEASAAGFFSGVQDDDKTNTLVVRGARRFRAAGRAHGAGTGTAGFQPGPDKNYQARLELLHA